MKATQEFKNYATYSINELEYKQLYWLIRAALSECLITTISVNEVLESDELPLYETQIPYNSGFIEERYVYQYSIKLASHILFELSQPNAFEEFLCEYTCWDVYKGHELILSLNIVQGIITINTNYIESPPENREEHTNEN